MPLPNDIQNELISIEKAKKDKRYFAPLYEKYYSQIFVFVFKKVKNESLAGDICSKIFLKAMLNIGRYEYKGFPFSSWLYRIASNEVNMFFRESSKAHFVEVTQNNVAAIVDEFDEVKEINLTKVLELIELLPSEQQELIEMRFFEQLSFKEIAAIFEITEANAKMKVYRILSKLEEKLKNMPEA